MDRENARLRKEDTPLPIKLRRSNGRATWTMPAENSKTDANTIRTKGQTTFQFWLSVWCGTMAAGCAFGFLFGCSNAGPAAGLFGAGLGSVFAGVFGVFTIPSVVLVTWCFWLSRFRVVMGGLAGGFTGIIATLVLTYDLPSESWATPTLAGLLGALGGGLAGRWYHLQAKAQGEPHQISRQHRWRFTLRDLLIRIAVISAVLATCVLVEHLVQLVQMRLKNDRKQQSCGSSLMVLRQCLRNYQKEHGTLPPVCTADEDGRPLLSWRVLALSCAYGGGFGLKTSVDFSRPWDSPTNARTFDSLNMKWLQCPSAEVTKPGITHYVAVVGPGTVWEGEGPNRLSESEKRILVIEWPESDIHWAEPRDITVDELLDWLESKPRRSDTNHPGCLLYVDGSKNVGELPTDSTPETVRRLLVGEPVRPRD